MTQGLSRRVVRMGARLNVVQLPVASVWDLLRLGVVDIGQLSDGQLKEIARSGPVDMSALTDDQLRRIAARSRQTQLLRPRIDALRAARKRITVEPATAN